MLKTNKSFFTIIELMVVVAIFAALFALLQPALQRTTWGAQHTVCLNNLKQTYNALSIYYEDNQLFGPWNVANGTMDGPHEHGANRDNGNPGNPAKVLVKDNDLLPAESLFCPLSPINKNDNYHPEASRNYWRTNKASFWSSYSYLYKPVRKGVIMADSQIQTWLYFENVYQIAYDIPYRLHYNLLNEDGSVYFLTDIDSEFLNYFPDAMFGK